MMTAIARLRVFFVVILAGLLLPACVTLMAPFDETTNELATNLQQKMSSHFEALEGATAPACLHQNYVGFYDEARADVNVLRVRADAFDMNTQTIQMATDLLTSINNLEELHRIRSGDGRCLQASDLAPLRRAFDSHLGGIIRLEIAKKRGEP